MQFPLKIIPFLFLPFLWPNTCSAKNVLITGCGRSGTQFITTFLSTSGLDLKHERPGGANGTVAWPMVVNAYTPFLEDFFGIPPHFDLVLHQVRNPLHVMTSWFVNVPNINRREWNFVRAHIPEIHKEDSLLAHCAKYWLYWNLKVEKIADWRYRIEDLDKILPQLGELFEIKLNKNILETLPQDINKWNPTPDKITWQQLRKELSPVLFWQIQLLAERYGYPLQD